MRRRWHGSQVESRRDETSLVYQGLGTWVLGSGGLVGEVGSPLCCGISPPAGEKRLHAVMSRRWAEDQSRPLLSPFRLAHLVRERPQKSSGPGGGRCGKEWFGSTMKGLSPCLRKRAIKKTRVGELALAGRVGRVGRRTWPGRSAVAAPGFPPLIRKGDGPNQHGSLPLDGRRLNARPLGWRWFKCPLVARPPGRGSWLVGAETGGCATCRFGSSSTTCPQFGAKRTTSLGEPSAKVKDIATKSRRKSERHRGLPPQTGICSGAVLLGESWVGGTTGAGPGTRTLGTSPRTPSVLTVLCSPTKGACAKAPPRAQRRRTGQRATRVACFGQAQAIVGPFG